MSELLKQALEIFAEKGEAGLFSFLDELYKKDPSLYAKLLVEVYGKVLETEPAEAAAMIRMAMRTDEVIQGFSIN